MDCDTSNKDPQPPNIPILISSNMRKKNNITNKSKEDEIIDSVTNKDLPANLKMFVLVGGIPIAYTPIQIKKLSHSRDTIYKEIILATYYKVPFGKLCMQERRLRIFKISFYFKS